MDEVIDIIPRLLGEIRDEIKETNRRLDDTNRSIDELRAETRAGFSAIEKKLDSALVSDRHIRDRLMALEQWAVGQGYATPSSLDSPEIG